MTRGKITRWPFYSAVALVLAPVVSGRLAPKTSGHCNLRPVPFRVSAPTG